MKQVKYIKQQLMSVAFIGLIAMLASCVKDDSTHLVDKSPAVITLKLTDTKDLVTRTAATSNERLIEDLYVLLLRKATSTAPYTYIAGERVDIANVVNNGQQTATLTTSLPIRVGDKVVILANTKIAFLPALTTTHTEDDINAFFTSGLWHLNRTVIERGKGMPMSGVINSWATGGAVCNMKRSVAKIQVAVALGSGVTDSDLSAGFTGAALANVNWAVYNQPQEGNVYEADPLRIDIPAAVTFANGTLDLKVADGLRYLPEYPNATNAKGATVINNAFNANRTCVIVQTTVSGASGYYRIDLQSNGTFLDIKRNHNYTVTINKVRSQGYTTIAEALANPPSNLEYVIDVVDNDTYIISSNGQYAIGVGSDDIKVYGSNGSGNKEYTLTTVKALKLPPGNTVTTNKITMPAGMTLTSPANGIITETTQTIKAKFTGPSNDFTGNITLTLGNITKTLKVTKESYRYKQVEILGLANFYEYGYNISRPLAGSNKVLVAPRNFGMDGIISCPTPTFYYPSHNFNASVTGTDLTILSSAINKAVPVDIIVLSQDVYLEASTAKILSDYVKKGGVLICFYEGNGGPLDAGEDYPNGSTTNLMRQIFGGTSITSKRINYAGQTPGGIGMLYALDRYNKVADNDPVLDGPFGSVRGKDWGEDASWARAIKGLPADQIDVYSDGYTSSYSYASQNSEMKDYVTGFKHKTLNLMFFGDGGFTSGWRTDYEHTGTTLCPFLWDANNAPISKNNYGGPNTLTTTNNAGYSRKSVYNSIIYANIMAWAIERATSHGINTP